MTLSRQWQTCSVLNHDFANKTTKCRKTRSSVRRGLTSKSSLPTYQSYNKLFKTMKRRSKCPCPPNATDIYLWLASQVSHKIREMLTQQLPVGRRGRMRTVPRVIQGPLDRGNNLSIRAAFIQSNNSLRLIWINKGQ